MNSIDEEIKKGLVIPVSNTIPRSWNILASSEVDKNLITIFKDRLIKVISNSRNNVLKVNDKNNNDYVFNLIKYYLSQFLFVTLTIKEANTDDEIINTCKFYHELEKTLFEAHSIKNLVLFHRPTPLDHLYDFLISTLYEKEITNIKYVLNNMNETQMGEFCYKHLLINIGYTIEDYSLLSNHQLAVAYVINEFNEQPCFQDYLIHFLGLNNIEEFFQIIQFADPSFSLEKLQMGVFSEQESKKLISILEFGIFNKRLVNNTEINLSL